MISRKTDRAARLAALATAFRAAAADLALAAWEARDRLADPAAAAAELPELSGRLDRVVERYTALSRSAGPARYRRPPVAEAVVDFEHGGYD